MDTTGNDQADVERDFYRVCCILCMITKDIFGDQGRAEK